MPTLNISDPENAAEVDLALNYNNTEVTIKYNIDSLLYHVQTYDGVEFDAYEDELEF